MFASVSTLKLFLTTKIYLKKFLLCDVVKRLIFSVSLLNHGQINGSCVNSPKESLEWPSPPPPPSSFLSQLRMPMIDSCKILLADPLISSAVSFQPFFSVRGCLLAFYVLVFSRGYVMLSFHGSPSAGLGA